MPAISAQLATACILMVSTRSLTNMAHGVSSDRKDDAAGLLMRLNVSVRDRSTSAPLGHTGHSVSKRETKSRAEQHGSSQSFSCSSLAGSARAGTRLDWRVPLETCKARPDLIKRWGRRGRVEVERRCLFWTWKDLVEASDLKALARWQEEVASVVCAGGGDAKPRQTNCHDE
jgi:hypothetical protein